MDKAQLEAIIAAAGGVGALKNADGLLDMIGQLEASGRYEAMLRQFNTARDEGDFRGRVLEINFAHQFHEAGISLDVAVRQSGCTGDIDFFWQTKGHSLFVEMKLLGEERRVRDELNARLEKYGAYCIAGGNDIRDVGRIQLDILSKATPKKFRCPPDADTINLIGIDVSELQHGAVDIADCVLAVAGNAGVARHFDALCCRPQVVGLFEEFSGDAGSEDQRAWVNNFSPEEGVPHPRDFIHGVLFLFRQPKERAALRYALNGEIVWNQSLIDVDRAGQVARAIHRAIKTAIPPVA
jgi:hypothetical protein